MNLFAAPIEQIRRDHDHVINACAKDVERPGAEATNSKSVRDGGDQIEYEDQDPRIHALWLEEMAKVGVEPKMSAFIKK